MSATLTFSDKNQKKKQTARMKKKTIEDINDIQALETQMHTLISSNHYLQLQIDEKDKRIVELTNQNAALLKAGKN